MKNWSKKHSWQQSASYYWTIYWIKSATGKQEQRFSKLVEGKNLEIRQLNSIIEKTKTSASETKTQTSNEINDDDLNELSNRIKNDYDKLRQYEEMIGNVQNGY